MLLARLNRLEKHTTTDPESLPKWQMRSVKHQCMFKATKNKFIFSPLIHGKDQDVAFFSNLSNNSNAITIDRTDAYLNGETEETFDEF